MKKTTLYLSIGALAFALQSCGGGSESAPEATAEAPQSMYADKKVETDPMKNKGIGPVTSVELAEVDAAMAEEGRLIYEEKCSACHKPPERYIGPAPKGILDRRTPEWVMNILLNPTEMLKQDPIASALLKEYNNVMMLNQNLSEEEARAISEYLRTL